MIQARQFASTEEQSIQSLSELKSLFQEYLKNISNKQVVLLSGPMGAGKTESVKTICQILGLEAGLSPSYAIHHQYKNAKKQIDHLDLFRLQSEDELESSGFWDLFQQEKSLIIIEWPERLNVDWLPLDWKLDFIQIVVSDQKRILKIKKEK